MARRPAKHVTEAYRRAHEDVARRTREAIEESRASRSPGHRLYGREGPRGGPERKAAPRSRSQEDIDRSRGFVSKLGGQAVPAGSPLSIRTGET
jgi:hypothetical protein